MIIIVGGGVIGLSLAFQLLKSGKKVTIIESNLAGHGASWAAAGYLEPSLHDTPLTQIEWRSLRMWPQFVEDVQAFSNTNVDYQTQGQLRIAYAESEADVRHDFERRKSAGWDISEVSAPQLATLEPALSRDIVMATYLPQVCWVDGRKLCQALTIAITALGGTVLQNTAVLQIIQEQSRAIGVQTHTGPIRGDAVVIAAGYQTDLIKNLPQDLPKSTGVKGVILTLAGNNTTGLRHLIKRPDGILCPRNDGRIIVGVTRDPGNFSQSPEAGAVAGLLQSGLRALPALANMAHTETVVGFRPYMKENTDPAIGESAQTAGLFYSLGHGADGFLRAPFYAQEVAELITKSG